MYNECIYTIKIQVKEDYNYVIRNLEIGWFLKKTFKKKKLK